MEVYSDPQAEWAQMYQEVWRIQRDMFYDPKCTARIGKRWAKYRPWVKHVAHRADLNFIFSELMGELVIGHAYVSGGDWQQPEAVTVGLLGADYEVANGFYRIKKIYNGENWNPTLRAPLTAGRECEHRRLHTRRERSPAHCRKTCTRSLKNSRQANDTHTQQPPKAWKAHEQSSSCRLPMNPHFATAIG